MSLDPGTSLQARYAPAGRCFGCGPANPSGLRIGSRPSSHDPAVLVARFEPHPEHEAFAGVVNGGILGTLLDCHANWRRRPTPSDRPVDLRAWVVDLAEDRATVEAEIASDGVVTATGQGIFVAVKPDHPAYDRW
jgi:acyl-coenzyme A thioesterase PaaI-like protein